MLQFFLGKTSGGGVVEPTRPPAMVAVRKSGTAIVSPRKSGAAGAGVRKNG